MEIELHLNASAQQVAGRLFSLRPDGPIAGWDVAGYYAKPNKAGTAITLSIVASLRRPGDADAALVSVQVRELAPARCLLSIWSDDPSEPEQALLAWLLDKARRDWPEIEPELEALAREVGMKRKARGTSSATDTNAREAVRLYSEGLTEEAIAERMAVSVKTVQRWRKRARELPGTK